MIIICTHSKTFSANSRLAIDSNRCVNVTLYMVVLSAHKLTSFQVEIGLRHTIKLALKLLQHMVNEYQCT